MKWMLVVVIFGSAPVMTDLLFATLEECLNADDAMRAEYAKLYNGWLERARQDPLRYNFPNSEKFAQDRFGLTNVGTCIPHAVVSK